jgi:hypothetical protein
MDEQQQAKLREPFPPEQVGQLPKGGTTLNYVGHGAVTDRLLAVDPTWNWEPLALDERGLPLFERDADGYPVGFWIRLTVSRLGYGSVGPKKADPEKELIGDALRNSAMRFGVALDLWVKGHDESAGGRDAAPRRQRPEPVGDPVADHAVHEALRHMIADLSPKELSALQAWWAETELPPIKKADRLTELQVERAMARIEFLLSAEPPSEARTEDDQRPFDEPGAAA